MPAIGSDSIARSSAVTLRSEVLKRSVHGELRDRAMAFASEIESQPASPRSAQQSDVHRARKAVASMPQAHALRAESARRSDDRRGG